MRTVESTPESGFEAASALFSAWFARAAAAEGATSASSTVAEGLQARKAEAILAASAASARCALDPGVEGPETTPPLILAFLFLF